MRFHPFAMTTPIAPPTTQSVTCEATGRDGLGGADAWDDILANGGATRATLGATDCSETAANPTQAEVVETAS